MAVKETLPLPSSSSSSAELNRKISYGRAQKPGQSPPQNRRNTRAEGEDEARWGSLAGKEWSMFEEGGFDSPSKSKEELRSKLQFDLTESAKQVSAATDYPFVRDWDHTFPPRCKGV